ncbi:MAG: 5-formyltetrahydrofolate cyclo-ligase [Ferruginibacter sp.]
MIKSELRKIYKTKRNNLTSPEIDKMEDLMLIQFQNFGFDIPDNVIVYAPCEDTNEYNPLLIIDYCKFKNPAVQFSYPVISGEELNAFHVNDDTAFTKNKYGIEEPVDSTIVAPEKIEMILIPLLIFDKSGQRVGYGKGYYDRFLKKCPDSTLKIGLSFFEPVDRILDVNKYDVPLDYCVTPMEVYYF